jgi:hypothetical protein
MTSSHRLVVAGLALGCALAVPVLAQDTSSRLLDRGRLITYQNNVPVATERFEYTQRGDSIVIAAGAERRVRQADGTDKRYGKGMVLITRVDDFGMINYTSNERIDDHLVTHSILPAETLLTIYSEKDGRGSADMIERPPGRIFAVDAGMASLFDVIGRNLQHRIYGSRPVQLIVLGTPARTVTATATLAGPDTVQWGGRRVITERIALRDSSAAFTLWLSPEGHMLRLESEDGRMVVMREPPDLPPPSRRGKPVPKPQPKPRSK